MSGPQPYLPALQRLMRINPVDYQDEGTQAHLRALAAPLDDLTGRAYAVALARLIAYAPEDALLLLGAERQIRRYPGEPLETYRRRVLGAWEFWRLAGTVPGILHALKDAGYRAIVREHFRDPDPDHWAEFSVVVGPAQTPKADARWDAQTTWGSGASWGFVLPAVPLDWLPDLIREVKPAHARLRRVIWSPRGRYWGGGVTWGEDRPAPKAQPYGYGVQTGVAEYVPGTERTDSGPAWGESDNETLYEYPGAPDDA